MRANTMRMMQTAALVSGLAVRAALASPPTTGLQAWYKADTGVTTDGNVNVSQWADQSGNNNHATQGTANMRPALSAATMPIGSSMAVITYGGNGDGSYDRLSLPNVSQDGGSGATVYFVVNDDADTTRSSVNWLNRVYTGGEPAIYGRASSGTKIGMYFSGWVNEASPTPSGWKAARFMWDGSGSSTMVTNHASGNGAYLASASIPARKSQWASIGLEGYGQHTFASFAEILIYNRALDASERAQVEDYLRLRYWGDLPPGQTAGDVTWSGGAGGGNPYWDVSANWAGGLAPISNTSATVYFKTNGQSVAGVLDADRRIGALSLGQSGHTIAHTNNLGGRTLTVAGTVANTAAASVTFTNGTLRLGTSNDTGHISFTYPSATLKLAPGATLDTTYAGTLQLAYDGASAGWGNGPGILDLRGATVAGGILRADNLLIHGGGQGNAGRLYLDNDSAVTSLAISNQLVIGSTAGGDTCYIGNPADEKLPSGVSVSVGTNPSQRGQLVVLRTRFTAGASTAKLVASGGGTFTAYLSSLDVVKHDLWPNQSSDRPITGILDLGAMNACAIDTTTFSIAADRSVSPANIDNLIGTVRLPPGAVHAGTVVVGGLTNSGVATLTMSNTTFTVTNAITLHKTARVTINVGAESGGLVISNAADTAFSMATATNGALRIVFQAPAAAQPFHGLLWKGDHAAALQALRDDGRLVVEDAGLGKSASLFVKGGYTGIGLPPPSGTMVLLR